MDWVGWDAGSLEGAPSIRAHPPINNLAEKVQVR